MIKLRYFYLPSPGPKNPDGTESPGNPCGKLTEYYGFFCEMLGDPEGRRFRAFWREGMTGRRWKTTSMPLCPRHLAEMRETEDSTDLERSGQQEHEEAYPYSAICTYKCTTPKCEYLAVIDWIC